MDLDDFLYSTFHGLNHITYDLDNLLHKNQPNLKDSLVDNFLHELNDFFYKESHIFRLKDLPKDTIFKITEDNDDYLIVEVVDSNNLPIKNTSCLPNDIYFIPKDMCDLNIDESLYKVEDLVQEEINYKNYLQLKDGIYKVVDKNGNVL